MVTSKTAASLLFFITVSVILTVSLCAEKIPPCGDRLWDITHGVDAEEGEADLVITLPNITDTFSSVSYILQCDDLVVNGTGKTTLIPSEGQNMTVYHVSVPEANDVKEWEAQGEWQAHSCILQLTYHPVDSSDTSEEDDSEETEGDEDTEDDESTAGDVGGTEGDGRRAGDVGGTEGEGRRARDVGGTEREGRRARDVGGTEGEGRRGRDVGGTEGEGRRARDVGGTEGDESRAVDADKTESDETRGDGDAEETESEETESDETRAENADDNMGGNTNEMECQLTLLTVLGRILPRCRLKSAQSLLEKVEVNKKLGQVLLNFYNSGNDVFTHDSKCEVDGLDEHNHANTLQDNMIPLAPPGADPPIIDIDFYPDCDNETVRSMYRDREMSECHMEIYQVCQEGHQLVKKIELDFEEGALKCESPKSSIDMLLESLELTFFIESRPVVALIFLLLCNIALYLLLIPIAVFKKVSGSCGSKTVTAEEKEPLLDHQQSPPESPPRYHTSPSHPHTSPPHSHTSPLHSHTSLSHCHMSPSHSDTSSPHRYTSPHTS